MGGRSLEGVGLPGACYTDALLHASCVQLRADTAERGKDSTMTAPSNSYDVIVVGGGISGRRNSSKLNFAVQCSHFNEDKLCTLIDCS